MKHKSLTLFVVAIISLLFQSCGPSENNIKQTAQAEINKKNTQEVVTAAQSSLSGTQAAVETQRSSLSQTQTAFAIFTLTQQPSPIPPTLSPTNTPIPEHSIAACPLFVYKGWKAIENSFVPEGKMGDTGDLDIDENFTLDPQRPDVIKISYNPMGSNHWAGVYWWTPGNNFGQSNVNFDIRCASKLTFFAKGEKGGEKVEFKVGGINGPNKDSILPAVSSGPIKLTNQWALYTIKLTGKDLSHIMGGFVMVANNDNNPQGSVIFLDNIKFEK